MLDLPADLPPDQRFVSRSHARAVLGCSDSYLDNLIKSGALPSYRIGARTVRLRLSDVHALVVPAPNHARSERAAR